MSITLAIIVVIVLAFFALAIKRPIAGVIGYLIIYLVFNPRSWYGVQLSQVLFRPSFVATSVLFLSCLINYHKLSWKFSRKEIAIYLFVAVAYLVSYFFGIGVTDVSSQYLTKLFKVSIVIFLFLRAVRTLEDLKVVLWTFVGGSLFLVWQAEQVGLFHDGRLDNIGGSDFNEANAFAIVIVFSIIMLGFKLFKAEWWKKMLIVPPIAFLLNTFIMAQSRAVFIGMFFGLIYVLFASPKKIKGQIIGYTVLSLILFSMLAHEKFWERMGTINEQAEFMIVDNSLWKANQKINRLDFWIASIDMFKDHPMGIGVKNFQALVPFYDPRNEGMDAHNTYVLCYSEIGIVGLFLFLFILFESLLQLGRVRVIAENMNDPFEVQMIRLSLSMFLIVYFTGPMMTHSYLYSEFTWIVFCLTICLERAVKDMVFFEKQEMVQE